MHSFYFKEYFLNVYYHFRLTESKNSTEFLYTLHPTSPHINILHNHRTILKTKEVTSGQYYDLNYQLYSGSASFSTVVSQFQDPFQDPPYT